jgi:dTDP-4-amino-4,6-dideoxygalactose transaminase
MMATGEGGMVASNSTEFIERVRDLRTYDQKPADKVRYNYKMSDVQAALGEMQFARLNDFIRRRKKIAQRYFKSLKAFNLKLPYENPEHIYYRFVVSLAADCNSVIQQLSRKGVGCARPVFLPIHRHLEMDGYPVTDKVWESALSIPLYPSLDTNAVEQIITNFINVLGSRPDRQ